MFAVDTQIIIYHFLPGEKSGLTENLIRWDPNWVTSPLWKYEFRNVVAGFIRRNQVSPIDAIRIAEEAELFFENREIQISPAVMIDLINRFPCTGYGLEFMAVAQEMGTKLITNDKDLLKNFPEKAISLNEFKEKKAT